MWESCESRYKVRASGHEHLMVLPQPPKCLGYMHVLPGLRTWSLRVTVTYVEDK